MQLLTAEEVSSLLRLSKARVYEIARQGLIPSVKVGRQLRFDEAALAEWIAQGGQALPGGWRREPSGT